MKLDSSLLRASVQKMIEMQIEHNIVVHPEWDRQGYAFHRAIWIECSELIEHFGWKWWKKQERSIPQVQLEIVDIWHFGLSMLIRDSYPTEAIAADLAIENQPTTDLDFINCVETLAQSALQGVFRVPEFAAVVHALPMDLSNLYGLYLGKNLLNRFRQKNGYKTGTYRKTWNGREDNEHLYDIVLGLDAWAEEFEEEIEVRLQSRYLGVV